MERKVLLKAGTSKTRVCPNKVNDSRFLAAVVISQKAGFIAEPLFYFFGGL
jgi:hypothetical protein